MDWEIWGRALVYLNSWLNSVRLLLCVSVKDEVLKTPVNCMLLLTRRIRIKVRSDTNEMLKNVGGNLKTVSMTYSENRVVILSVSEQYPVFVSRKKLCKTLVFISSASIVYIEVLKLASIFLWPYRYPIQSIWQSFVQIFHTCPWKHCGSFDSAHYCMPFCWYVFSEPGLTFLLFYTFPVICLSSDKRLTEWFFTSLNTTRCRLCRS